MIYKYIENDGKKELIGVMIDIETTGLSEGSDEVVNICIAGMSDDLQVLFLTDIWGIPYKKYIPRELVLKTGLRNMDVIQFSQGMSMLEHAKEVIALLHSIKDKIVVGQNIKFDIGMLEQFPSMYSMKDPTLLFPNRLDIMKIYKTEESGAKNLNAQMKALNITEGLINLTLSGWTKNNQMFRHTGLYDVAAQYLVLRKLSQLKGGMSLSELYRNFK